MEFKERKSNFKENVKDIKAQKYSKIDTAKDIGIFQGKKFLNFSLSKGYGTSKRSIAGYINFLTKENAENNTAVSESQKLWNDSYIIRNFASKNSLKGIGHSRYMLEKKFLKENKRAINRKSAFSPFKMRREAFNKQTALKQKQIAKMMTKKAGNKIVNTLGINTSGSFFQGIRNLSRAFKSVGKALGIVLSSLGTLFKVIGGILVPIMLIVIIISVIAASLSGGIDELNLDMLTGTAVISNEKADVRILKEDTELISFKSKIIKNKFEYRQRTIRVTGKIKKDKISIKGKFANKEIALEGVIVNGKAELTGYMGENAIRALNGSMIGSGKATKLGKRILSVARKYKNPYGSYPNLCLGFVYDVYRQAGVTENLSGGCASEAREKYATKKGPIPIGAAIFSAPSYKSHVMCSCGRDAGHVGIYIGNNKVLGSQVPAIYTLDTWNKVIGYGGYYMPKK